jgi:hypothetical protein
VGARIDFPEPKKNREVVLCFANFPGYASPSPVSGFGLARLVFFKLFSGLDHHW